MIDVATKILATGSLLGAGILAWEASRQLHLEPWKNPDDCRHEEFAARALAMISVVLAFGAGFLL